jgi:flagellar motor switch protein FliG
MSEMNAIDKVAVLLITLPSDLSSKIIQNMDEKYIKEVVSRMYSLKDLKEEDCLKVIEEFYQTYTESKS